MRALAPKRQPTPPTPKQGVLLPHLGQFVVGEALEDRFEAVRRYRGAFTLLDGRFGGVSQDRGGQRLLSASSVLPCC